MKSPTLSKITAISRVLAIHPLTLMTLSYTGGNASEVEAIVARVRREILALRQAPKR